MVKQKGNLIMGKRGNKRKKIYTRVCKRCDRIFETTCRGSRLSCPDCYKPTGWASRNAKKAKKEG